MTKPQASTRGSARREELLRVAARVFARKGFSNATVRDLGEEAGILSGSLYHHFESKDAILEDLLRGLFEAMEAGYIVAVEPDRSPEDTIRDLLVTGYGYLGKYSDEIHVLYNDLAYISRVPRLSFVADWTERLEQIWLEPIERGIADGSFRHDLDPELTYRVLMGSLVAAVRWFNPAGEMTAEELGASVATVFLGGLLAPVPVES